MPADLPRNGNLQTPHGMFDFVSLQAGIMPC